MTGDQPSQTAFGGPDHDPLVSVLMPAFNAGPFIQEAFESLRSQTYTNWELLVLDDGSTDGTTEIVSAWDDPRVRKFSNRTNEGYLRSCNRLFDEVRGELVTFQDADDTSIPERLALCVAAFRNDPSPDFLTTAFCRTDARGIPLRAEQHPAPDYRRYASDPDYYPTVCCATIMLRTTLLAKVGGYHPFFERLGGEDYHWLFMLARNGCGTHLRTEAYRYRAHPAQTHLRNTHPLKYFTADIDRSVRRQLLTDNTYALDHWADLRSEWERHITQHPQDIAYRRATIALNREGWAKALRETFRIIPSAPYRPSSYGHTTRMFYHMVRRMRR